MYYIFGGTLFRHLFERGWPFGVFKVYAANAKQAKELAEKLKKWFEENKGKKMTIEQFVNEFSKETGMNLYGIRFGLTFSIFDWFNPSKWSSYSYPSFTAIKEGGAVEVTVYPYDEKAQRLFEGYVSFGVAVADLAGTVGIPIGVLVSSVPRRVAVIEAMYEGNKIKAVVVVAYPKAVKIMKEMHWKPIEVYGKKIVWVKTFDSERKFADEISRVAAKLIDLGMLIFSRGLAKEILRLRV